MEFSPPKNLSSTGEYGDIHHTHRHLIRNSLKTQLSPVSLGLPEAGLYVSPLKLGLPEGRAVSPLSLEIPMILDSFLTSTWSSGSLWKSTIPSVLTFDARGKAFAA